MNKKITALFCAVILMAAVFSACGNKGYLLAKDENGFEHAYVTDEDGSTLLNEDGDIRVYETDKNGKIVKDENGKPKENSVKMPEILITDNKYRTSEFEFNIPAGWKAGDKTFIAESEDGLSRIQFNKIDGSAAQFNATVSEEVIMADKIVEEVKESGGKTDLTKGNTKITSNQIDAFYMIFYAEIEKDGEKNLLRTCSAYFTFEDKIYKAFYQTSKDEELSIDQVVEIFNNLTLKQTEKAEASSAS